MSNQIRPSGMPCPECGTKIIVDIQQLLMQGKVVCPACNLELIVNQQKSAESLGILAQFQQDFGQANQQAQAAQQVSGRGRATSRRRQRRRATTRRRRT